MPKPLIAILALALSFAVAELGARAYLPGALFVDERNSLFRFDPELGWFPRESSGGTFQGTIPFKVQHNADGFRDGRTGPETLRRIAVVGDSFVWGYDSEADDRFTEILARGMRGYQVLNLGVSGYGPDQELLLLRRFIPRYQPSAVLLVFCVENDFQDSASNLRYDGYYKPWFARTATGLEIRGVPVPKSLRYWQAEYPAWFRSRLVTLAAGAIIRRLHPEVEGENVALDLVLQMRREVEARGGKFFVALTRRHQGMEDRLADEKIGFVSLDLAERFQEHGHHWTPRGQRTVAAQVQKLLAGSLPKVATFER